MNFASGGEQDDTPTGWWGLLILLLVMLAVEIFCCVGLFRWAFGN